jgi:amidophosphoribosyltransferase
MAKMGDFIAFEATMTLLRDQGKEDYIRHIYQKCKEQEDNPKELIKNYVKEIYEVFTYEEVSKKFSELLTPEGINAEVEIIYQTIDKLHEGCPKNLGDWYFTGDYPTPGGNKVVNKSFINYIEGKNVRAY